MTRRQRGPGYVYFMAHEELMKIGYSADPYGRLVDFSATYPRITLSHAIATNAMSFLERLVHWQLRECHVQEAAHPGEEWFKVSDADMARLRLVRRYHLKPEVMDWLSQGYGPALRWR
jgi:T5orf172 domain